MLSVRITGGKMKTATEFTKQMTNFQKLVVLILLVAAVGLFWFWRKDVEYNRCYNIAKDMNSATDEQTQNFLGGRCGRILKDSVN